MSCLYNSAICITVCEYKKYLDYYHIEVIFLALFQICVDHYLLEVKYVTVSASQHPQ